MELSQQKTAGFIALRYVFSKKKHNIINVISLVSMLGIMVSSAALVVVLSVFNGMEEMIGGWFNSFNPDFKITLVEGKSFPVDSFPMDALRRMPEVEAVDEVVSDMALITYNDRQELLTIKGVGDDYVSRNRLDEILIDGKFDLWQGEQPCVVAGAVAAGKLQINLLNYELMKTYYPKRTKKNLARAADAFNTRYLFPTGVFMSNTNYDDDVIFCPIAFARDLMHYEGEVTSVEVKLRPSVHYAKCQKEVEKVVGDRFKVQNKYQQEASLFKTMQSEKLIIYIILAFILLVAAFNIIGSLGMLMLEKKDDMAVLRHLGAGESLIRRVFLYEGVAVSFVGGLLGVLLGVVICLIQQIFHVVKIGDGSTGYIIPYYPVHIRVTDLLLVLLTILIVSLLTSFLPARKLKQATSNPYMS